MTKSFTPGTSNAVLTPVSETLIFKGRPGDLRLGEWLLTQKPAQNGLQHSIAIFGCPDDTGVTLNRGRPGAQEGPDEIRRAFYKMASPSPGSWDSVALLDLGDISIGSSILNTHKNAFEASRRLSEDHDVVVLLGGGHDFAAPGISGWIAGKKNLNSNHRFGVLNIDPHLDVREPENGLPNSGTPFRVLLESKNVLGHHLVQFGCRENRNAPIHWQYCKTAESQLVPLSLLRSTPLSVPQEFARQLTRLARTVNEIAVTLDMDSCCEVLGTSAAPALGFTVQELYEIAYLAGKHPSVRYFEIAEVAPSLDPSKKTALAAAEILYGFISGKIACFSKKTSVLQKIKKSKTVKNRKKTSKQK